MKRHPVFTTLLVILLQAAASLSLAQDDVPELRAQFVVRGGYVAVDEQRSQLKLKSREAAYAGCGLTPKAIQRELVDYLNGLLRSRGKVFDLVAQGAAPTDASDAEGIARWQRINAARREFSKVDLQAQALLQLDADWLAAGDRLQAWKRQHHDRFPPVSDGTQTIFDVLKASVNDARLLDGPLLKLNLDPDEFGDDRPDDGIVSFRIAPPLLRRDRPLVPSTNVAEWERLIPGLVEHVVRPRECKLWYRDKLIEPAQDYLEVRGISVQPLRHRHDEAQTGGLVLAAPPKPGVAGIAPELPSFARAQFGGRIHLAPDPVIEDVYIEADPADAATLRRVLYLLLPSSDFSRVMARPADYICVAEAVWKDALPSTGRRPSTLRLNLLEGPGARLQFGNEVMTRRALAQRLQRTALIGYEAKLALERELPAQRRTVGSLIVQPAGGAAAAAAGGAAAAELRDCAKAAAAPAAAAAAAAVKDADALVVTENADLVQPNSNANAAGSDTSQHSGSSASKKPLPAASEHRHRLDLSAEYQAGKPLLATLEFSRVGLSKEDTWSLRLGRQAKASGAFSYSRDFVAFDRLQRRLQLSLRGFSDFDPDRTLASTNNSSIAAETRSSGGELRATLDLWRDEAASFSHIDLGLADYRSETNPTAAASSANRSRSHIRLADVSWQVAKAWPRTAASAQVEATLSLSRGSADGQRFTKAGIDLAHHQFVGALTRWDLRLHARAVRGAAPASEWPSFGGEDSVRGYRADVASARRAWVLQNEYWMPLPWVPESPTLARTLRRSVALAFIADIGGLSGGAAGLSGQKAGLGAGLRYVYNDSVTMRLDWARPVGSVAPEHRRGRLYFTVSSWSIP